MKIYAPEPKDLIRLQICRQLEDTEYITLCECTIPEVIQHLSKLIEKQKIPVFVKGKKTSINIRNALGGKNGKSTSVSFYGLSPKETKELIIKSL